MAIKGLMMHQKLRGTGMVVSRATMLQPRITTSTKNRKGTGKDGEGRSEESLACARKVAMNKCWAVLVLPIAAVASLPTTTLFSILPSPPPLLLPPVLAEETDSKYTQLRAMIMDAKFLSRRKKENSLP